MAPAVLSPACRRKLSPANRHFLQCLYNLQTPERRIPTLSTLSNSPRPHRTSTQEDPEPLAHPKHPGTSSPQRLVKATCIVPTPAPPVHTAASGFHDNHIGSDTLLATPTLDCIPQTMTTFTSPAPFCHILSAPPTPGAPAPKGPRRSESHYPRPSPPCFLFPHRIVPAHGVARNTPVPSVLPANCTDTGNCLSTGHVALLAVSLLCVAAAFAWTVVAWWVHCPPASIQGKKSTVGAKGRTSGTRISDSVRNWVWECVLGGSTKKKKPIDKPSKYAPRLRNEDTETDNEVRRSGEGTSPNLRRLAGLANPASGRGGSLVELRQRTHGGHGRVGVRPRSQFVLEPVGMNDGSTRAVPPPATATAASGLSNAERMLSKSALYLRRQNRARGISTPTSILPHSTPHETAKETPKPPETPPRNSETVPHTPSPSHQTSSLVPSPLNPVRIPVESPTRSSPSSPTTIHQHPSPRRRTSTTWKTLHTIFSTGPSSPSPPAPSPPPSPFSPSSTYSPKRFQPYRTSTADLDAVEAGRRGAGWTPLGHEGSESVLRMSEENDTRRAQHRQSWITSIDDVVTRAVGKVARWTDDAGGRREEGLLLPVAE
ncbi:hypothetical protein M011DRAFT_462639 [Sporormia fimetaria CBS 119925]|uniref:Uncharacterized protein n=1 Tax=Sporormia fimetaria CBS 119925 TaxID=1340428 RepID=A0A6A6UWH0_9PLEO|nr:hypothetical protein M011DRAFT_462639 [Sporormia fimetaria CBS 119925]